MGHHVDEVQVGSVERCPYVCEVVPPYFGVSVVRGVVGANGSKRYWWSRVALHIVAVLLRTPRYRPYVARHPYYRVRKDLSQPGQ